MAKLYTYSFLDMTGSLNSPLVGSYIFSGQGVGSVAVNKTVDRSVLDNAADTAAVISKIAGNNGQLVLECLMNSDVHKYMLKWFAAHWAAPTVDWATTTVYLRNNSTGGGHICTGVAPLKEPDISYQAEAQRVTWTLIVADIQNIPV